jgi:hypothetical protein
LYLLSVYYNENRKQIRKTVKTEIMKTTMKLLAAGTFATFIFLVGNVNAEGKQAKASGRENIEEALQVERWMTNENIWNSSDTGTEILAKETENELQIETWMLNTNLWDTHGYTAEETDEPLQIESWMTTEELWNNNSNDVQEEALTVETWMIDNNVWNK